MPYPPFAEIETNYTAFQQGQGDNSFPGQQVDVDLANLKEAVDELNIFVRGITRSDGEIGNETIGIDQLKPSLQLGIFVPEEVLDVLTITSLLAVETGALADGQLAYAREYHSGTGHGGGFLVWDAASIEDADDGLIFGTGTGRWKRVESAKNGPLRLEWWGLGNDAAGDIAAVINAFKALYTTEANYLHCDGIPVQPDQQIYLNNNNLNIGNGLNNRDKFIVGLNIRPVAGTWGSGDAAFFIRGDTTTNLLRATVFQNCHFDGSNLADYAFKASGYYHMKLVDCAIHDALVAPFYDSDEFSGGSSNGLVLQDCDIRVPFGSGAGKTGIILESADVVIKGGWTSWMETCLSSSEGGFKVEGHHFVPSTGGAGIICTRPLNVSIIGCDFDDGAYILFDDTADPINQWRKITIMGNDHVVRPENTNTLEFKTGSASNFILGLTIVGNNTAPESATSAEVYIAFTTAGAGTWLSNWDCVFAHAQMGTITLGNIAGRRLLTAGQTSDVYQGADDDLVIRHKDGTEANLRFWNSSNAGTAMPAVFGGGSAGQEAGFANGSGATVRISSTGNFRPGADGTQDCGTAALSWRNVYTDKLTLASIADAADDAAAATAGVAVGEVYRTGSALKVRVA